MNIKHQQTHIIQPISDSNSNNTREIQSNQKHIFMKNQFFKNIQSKRGFFLQIGRGGATISFKNTLSHLLISPIWMKDSPPLTLKLFRKWEEEEGRMSLVLEACLHGWSMFISKKKKRVRVYVLWMEKKENQEEGMKNLNGERRGRGVITFENLEEERNLDGENFWEELKCVF